MLPNNILIYFENLKDNRYMYCCNIPTNLHRYDLSSNLITVIVHGSYKPTIHEYETIWLAILQGITINFARNSVCQDNLLINVLHGQRQITF